MFPLSAESLFSYYHKGVRIMPLVSFFGQLKSADRKLVFGLLACSLFFGAVGQTRADHVRALFDLSTPTSGPFPSNWFSVADDTQNTGRRVNMPLPDPTTHASDYQDAQVLNTLDGFNLQPRLSIPFAGP